MKNQSILDQIHEQTMNSVSTSPFFEHVRKMELLSKKGRPSKVREQVQNSIFQQAKSATIRSRNRLLVIF